MPAMPWLMDRGTYTTTVVRVPARMDISMVLVPWAAASWKERPCSRKRKQLSRMTMELSTIMPMARIRPVPVRTFMSNPAKFSTMIASSTERGILIPTTRLPFQSPKNRNRTAMASNTPTSRVWRMLCRVTVMLSASLLMTS